MFDIIVGERVINKAEKIGTIVSFDDKYIFVDFKTELHKYNSMHLNKAF